MLNHWSKNRVIDTYEINENNVASISPNHFGRTLDVLPIEGKSSLSNWDLAGYYLDSPLNDNEWRATEWMPYIQGQLAADPEYSFIVDPNLPRPNQGQAESVVSKYEELAGLTNIQLVNEQSLIVGAVDHEIQPYWEKMLIGTMIHEVADARDRQELRDNFFTGGISSVEDILEDPEYTQDPKVQFAYAQSAAFLELPEEYKLKFSTMELEEQWDIIYLEDADRLSYIDRYSDDLPVVKEKSTYTSSLRDQRYNADIDGVLDKFSSHLGMTGIDYKDVFDQEFYEQTVPMDFTPVSQVLSDVFLLYYGILDRIPDSDGFQYWLNDFVKQGGNIEFMAQSFLDSAEFQEKINGTAGEPVSFDDTLTALYNVVLDRDPDQDGYNYWVDEHEAGGTTSGIAVSFIRSDEFLESARPEMNFVMAGTFGPNLKDIDFAEIGLPVPEVDLVGTYDAYADDGYEGVLL